MGTNPSHFSDDGARPVGRVSWDDCQEFCRRLTAKYRGTYRLPTEAEWEYACRAGTPGPCAGTGKINDMAWHRGNSNDQPHPVAQKLPNAWGLHDMLGNVSEWCQDWHAETYYKKPAAALDPAGPRRGAMRVLRGGSYYFPRGRSAQRGSGFADVRADNVGLRLVVELDVLAETPRISGDD